MDNYLTRLSTVMIELSKSADPVDRICCLLLVEEALNLQNFLKESR
jgi:hypothetical protein